MTIQPKTDTDIKVNSIVPKSGTTLALTATEVPITGHLDVTGDGDISGDLDIVGTITAGGGLDFVPRLGTTVDNTLVRFDGTTGAIQTTGINVDDSDIIDGFKGRINQQTGTTYTLLSTDTGKIVELNNASAITLTLPNSLLPGWCATIVQTAAGQVTFSPAGGATLNNRQAYTKTAGQWAMATLYVRSNSGGSSAVYVLGGDCAS